MLQIKNSKSKNPPKKQIPRKFPLPTKENREKMGLTGFEPVTSAV